MEQVNTPLPKNADARTLKRTHTFFFGKKHKGKTVDQVLQEDPTFILWAQDNVAFIRFDEEVMSLAKQNAGKVSPGFVPTVEDLKLHSSILHNLSQGLDSYAENGIRQVHGMGNDVPVHKTLDYFKRLAAYFIALEEQKEKEAEEK